LEVIALEPNEAGHHRLLENLDRIRPHNVQVIRAAASSHHGPAYLATASERLGICSTGKVADSGGQAIELITIDSLVTHHPVTVIKLDVEGHEVQALKGAADTLEATRPTLFVEVNSRSGGDRTDEVVGFLSSFGYRGELLDGRNMVFR
jgi:FkbM family methyltransferase